jgi:hypothetical protein
MYSEQLEELIALVIQDGNLTEQKRKIIERRAQKEGEDVEEVILVTEMRLKQCSSSSELIVNDADPQAQSYTSENEIEDPYVTGNWTKFFRDNNCYIIPPSNSKRVHKLVDKWKKYAEKWHWTGNSVDQYPEGEYYRVKSPMKNPCFNPFSGTGDEKGFLEYFKKELDMFDKINEEIIELCIKP